MKIISNESKRRKLWPESLARWLCFVGCIAGLAMVAGMGLIRTHAQESFPLPAINPPGAKASSPPTPGTTSSNAQQPGAPAAQTNETEVAKQCADILKMATELKAEVDKSQKDQLSVPVVRKAGEIEQLAHKVRTNSGKS
jgi:hypothetical protein